MIHFKQRIRNNKYWGYKQHRRTEIRRNRRWHSSIRLLFRWLHIVWGVSKSKTEGGYLVYINSREEYDYILERIQQLGYENKQFRLGGRREIGDNNYYWINEDNEIYGEPINGSEYWNSDDWLPEEPSYRDGNIVENCLDIYYNKNADSWGWNDTPDDIVASVPYYSGKVGYIVEFED